MLRSSNAIQSATSSRVNLPMSQSTATGLQTQVPAAYPSLSVDSPLPTTNFHSIDKETPSGDSSAPPPSERTAEGQQARIFPAYSTSTLSQQQRFNQPSSASLACLNSPKTTSQFGLCFASAISGSMPCVPSLLDARAAKFPQPRIFQHVSPQELPGPIRASNPAMASYARVAAAETVIALASPTSASLNDDHTRDIPGRAGASTVFSESESTPLSSPRRFGAAASPTSVAEVFQQQRCFPAKQKEGKFKIELCRNFDKPGGCPFGNSCTYAHGMHELRTKPLLAQHLEGRLDANSYRRYPCFDQVSCGVCSIGPDCPCLHDPRTGGQFKAILRQTDYQRPKNVPEEVSKMYQSQLSALQGVSPVYGFVPSSVWKANDDESTSLAAFFDFYGYCCNMADGLTDKVASWPAFSGSSVSVTEIHRLSIALELRMARKAQSFVFKPTHLFCGEPVLLIQTRYFLIDGYEVVSISNDLGELRCGSNAAVICAREIAFGPVGDATVRPTSIWFNVDDKSIIECSTKELRKSAYQLWNDKRSFKFASTGANSELERQIDEFPPFISHQPADEAAFGLVTGIQVHRRDVLRIIVSSMSPSIAQEELQSLDLRGQGLYDSFLSQKRHWMTSWQWPRKKRSGMIDKTTPLPNINGVYTVSSADLLINDRGNVVRDRVPLTNGHLWESFVSTMGSGERLDSDFRLGTLKDLSLEDGAATLPLGRMPHLHRQQSIGADGGNCPDPIPNLSPLEQILKKWEMHMEVHL